MSVLRPIYGAILIAIFLTTGPALGGGNGDRKVKIPDAQALIDECWAISLDQRSTGNTRLHVLGHERTIQCLENVALSELAMIFDQKNGLSRKAAQERLRSLTHAANHVYVPIFNDNKFCGSNCGMANAIAHLPEAARVLEQVIRTTFALRAAYERLRYGLPTAR